MSGTTGKKTGVHEKSGHTLGRILYSRDEIAAAVTKIAAEIEAAARSRELTILGILKGGARFACDLMTAYEGPYFYEFISASSYGMELNSCGAVEFHHYRLDRELIDNRPVLLVDDICDSGATFGAVAGRILADYMPETLYTCSLIWREGAGFTPDMWGFHYPGREFLVGYGLGAGEHYRYLNEIRVLNQG
jgi:hypoxanthine phosphoribosyltransferase